MDAFQLLWIELRLDGDTLVSKLNAFQDKHRTSRLVSVILLPRNPGGAMTYQTVWALPSRGESEEPLADQLMKIRNRAIAKGMKLLSIEEIDALLGRRSEE